MAGLQLDGEEDEAAQQEGEAPGGRHQQVGPPHAQDHRVAQRPRDVYVPVHIQQNCLINMISKAYICIWELLSKWD